MFGKGGKNGRRAVRGSGFFDGLHPRIVSLEVQPIDLMGLGSVIDSHIVTRVPRGKSLPGGS